MAVKEKKVELIELFYDLIYVYAISRLTMLIEEPEGGIIPLHGYPMGGAPLRALPALYAAEVYRRLRDSRFYGHDGSSGCKG